MATEIPKAADFIRTSSKCFSTYIQRNLRKKKLEILLIPKEPLLFCPWSVSAITANAASFMKATTAVVSQAIKGQFPD